MIYNNLEPSVLQDVFSNKIINTSEGTNIAVKDSAGAPFIDFSLEGKSEQKSYTGKNLLDIKSNANIQVNATGDIRNGYVVNVSEIGRYYIFVKPTQNINFYYGAQDTSYNVAQSSPLTPTDNFGFIDISDTTQKIVIWAGTGIANASSYLEQIMVAKSDIVIDYESYVGAMPSPNPLYPQSINSVADSGNLDVISCGKNLAVLKSLSRLEENNGVFTNTNTDNRNYWNIVVGNGKITYFSERIDKIGKFSKTFTSPDDNTQLIIKYSGSSVDYHAYFDTSLVKADTTITFSLDVLGLDTTKIGGFSFSNVQVEYDNVATPYEPYQETKATLNLSEPLRSLPNGVKDTIERNADGSYKVVRRVGSYIFDGSDDEKWEELNNDTMTAHTSYYFKNNNLNIQIPPNHNSKIGLLCSHFIENTVNSTIQKSKNSNGNFALTTSKAFYFRDDNLTTLSDWKTRLQANPITVQYELATPTEEVINPYETEQLQQLKTFEGGTNVYTDTFVVADSIKVVEPNLKIMYYKNTDAGKVISNLVPPEATENKSGLMSAQDKLKVNQSGLISQWRETRNITANNAFAIELVDMTLEMRDKLPIGKPAKLVVQFNVGSKNAAYYLMYDVVLGIANTPVTSDPVLEYDYYYGGGGNGVEATTKNLRYAYKSGVGNVLELMCNFTSFFGTDVTLSTIIDFYLYA